MRGAAVYTAQRNEKRKKDSIILQLFHFVNSVLIRWLRR